MVKNVLSEHTVVLLNPSGKLFKSSVARLKKFHTGFTLVKSDAGSDSLVLPTDTICVRHDDLLKPFRAATKPKRVRHKIVENKIIPVLLEPFFGAKPIDLRRSERLRLKNT